MWVGVVIAIGLAALFAFIFFTPRKIMLNTWERGLKYKDSQFVETLGPGTHRYNARSESIRAVDIRPRVLAITGQEILTADGVSLKFSVAVNYGICDPALAHHSVVSYVETLHMYVQLALREVIAAVDVDKARSARVELSAKLKELCEAKCRAIGVDILDAAIKDVTFPGKLKEVFAQVVNAKIEAQALLERTRGESASLRNLANVARMLESNPQFLQIRTLQAIEKSTGNTFVLGGGSGLTLVPVRQSAPTASKVAPIQPPVEGDEEATDS